jgi:hypothetical protein
MDSRRNSTFRMKPHKELTNKENKMKKINENDLWGKYE